MDFLGHLDSNVIDSKKSLKKDTNSNFLLSPSSTLPYESNSSPSSLALQKETKGNSKTNSKTKNKTWTRKRLKLRLMCRLIEFIQVSIYLELLVLDCRILKEIYLIFDNYQIIICRQGRTS